MKALLNPLWAFLKLFFIINTFVIPSKDVLYWQLYSECTVECRANGLQKIWRESFVPQSSYKWEKDFLLPSNYEARNGTILCHPHTMRWIVGVIFLMYNFKIIIAILGFNTWTSFQKLLWAVSKPQNTMFLKEAFKSFFFFKFLLRFWLEFSEFAPSVFWFRAKRSFKNNQFFFFWSFSNMS